MHDNVGQFFCLFSLLSVEDKSHELSDFIWDRVQLSPMAALLWVTATFAVCKLVQVCAFKSYKS